MKPFIKIMKALSDPNRVKILKMLQKKALCVCEITFALELAQSTVSKHLKVLEEAGLVVFEKSGPWVNYLLADGSDSPYAEVMLRHLADWLEDESQIAALVQKIKTVDRSRVCAA
jgi:ArsR family transcriptional regulator